MNDMYIEPISFIVPRRAEVFQDDIYPPTIGLKPALSAAEWFGGKEGIPPKIDLAAIYAGEEPTEVASDYKPPAREPSPKPASPVRKAPVLEPEPTPSTLKGPPPSMKEQTASIKNLASKYDDHEEEVDDQDDSSSFEEVARPIERSAPSSQPPSSAAAAAPGLRSVGDALSPVKDKPDDYAQASKIAASQSTATLIKAQATTLSQTKPEPIAEQLPSSRDPASSSRLGGTATAGKTSHVDVGAVKGEEEGVQASLTEIKSLLEQQQRAMKSQNETIGRLTQEVEGLRARIGER